MKYLINNYKTKYEVHDIVLYHKYYYLITINGFKYSSYYIDTLEYYIQTRIVYTNTTTKISI